MTDQSEIDEHIRTAVQAHQRIDSLRQWAVRQEADLLAKAEVADEVDPDEIESIPGDPETLRRAADRIRTVYERIEQGDLSRVRNARNND